MGDVMSSLGTAGGEFLSGLGNIGSNIGSDLAQGFSGGGAGGLDIGKLFSGGLTPGINPPGVAALNPGAATSGTTPISFAAPPSLSGLETGADFTGANPINPAGGGFLQKLLSNPTSLASLGALGYDLIQGSQTPKEVKQLQAQAGQDQALAANETSLAQGGQLGFLGASGDAAVEQAKKANEAQIRARYASMGMSGSSAEQADLAAAREASLASRFQAGQSLAATGFSEASAASGQASQLLQAILQAETAQGTDFGNALAEFAGAAIRPEVQPAAG